jgi:hypothetical protein
MASERHGVIETHAQITKMKKNESGVSKTEAEASESEAEKNGNRRRIKRKWHGVTKSWRKWRNNEAASCLGAANISYQAAAASKAMA